MQRLLENDTLNLKTAFDQARSLDLAQQHADVYQSSVTTVNVLQLLKLE